MVAEIGDQQSEGDSADRSASSSAGDGHKPLDFSAAKLVRRIPIFTDLTRTHTHTHTKNSRPFWILSPKHRLSICLYRLAANLRRKPRALQRESQTSANYKLWRIIRTSTTVEEAGSINDRLSDRLYTLHALSIRLTC